MKILSAHSLQKKIKQTTILHDVSISISQGDVIGLLGPNGAGKTTVFYIIAGLIRSDNGTVTLGDVDISNYSLSSRAKLGIGYLPQEPSVFRKLSVYENISGVLELNHELNRTVIKSRTEELIEEFNLHKVVKNKGYQLSGGERRRVEIARTLASNPDFILLDEPFSGIDPISVIEIQAMIMDLKKKGIGILITDHNVRETLKICDSASILYQGRVISKGAPNAILNDAKVKEVYLGNSFLI
jgi:lipopolysaccharide export system ATP-binding protein